MAIDSRLSQREYEKFAESSTSTGQVALKVINPDGTNVGSGITVTAGDIEIGAVEIKDATSDTRAVVGAGGLAVDLGSNNDVSLNAGTNLIGYVQNGYRTDSFQATITSADAQTATQVKAHEDGKSIYITDLIISVGAAMNVQLQDDTGSPVVLMEQIYLPANSVFSKQFQTPLKASVGQDVDVVASGAGNISVTITGYIV